MSIYQFIIYNLQLAYQYKDYTPIVLLSPDTIYTDLQQIINN